VSTLGSDLPYTNASPGKYVVGDVDYSIRSSGGDPIKTTNVCAWTHTISAPEHWAVVRVDDFIALHEMLSPENSLTIQEIMKAEPPVKKPLKGKWVDTTVVASSRCRDMLSCPASLHHSCRW
jgi:hypothetical protein